MELIYKALLEIKFKNIRSLETLIRIKKIYEGCWQDDLPKLKRLKRLEDITIGRVLSDRERKKMIHIIENPAVYTNGIQSEIDDLKHEKEKYQPFYDLSETEQVNHLKYLALIKKKDEESGLVLLKETKMSCAKAFTSIPDRYFQMSMHDLENEISTWFHDFFGEA